MLFLQSAMTVQGMGAEEGGREGGGEFKVRVKRGVARLCANV